MLTFLRHILNDGKNIHIFKLIGGNKMERNEETSKRHQERIKRENLEKAR